MKHRSEKWKKVYTFTPVGSTLVNLEDARKINPSQKAVKNIVWIQNSGPR